VILTFRVEVIRVKVHGIPHSRGFFKVAEGKFVEDVIKEAVLYSEYEAFRKMFEGLDFVV
jgi:hypothetical protein